MSVSSQSSESGKSTPGKSKTFSETGGVNDKSCRKKKKPCLPECMLTHVIYFESSVPFKTEFNLLSRNDTANDVTAVESVLCRKSIMMSCFRD